MKKSLLFIPFLIIILFTHPVFAQEAKNTFVLSGNLTHFAQISDHRDTERGSYTYPFDPGIEALYFRHLFKNISLGTGIGYQKGRNSDFIHNQRKFDFVEVNIPVLLSRYYKFDKRKGMLITTGLYGGKTFLRKVEWMGSATGWLNQPDFDPELSYKSNDVVFLDIFFGAGYSYSILQKSSISVMPFAKYRVNTVWLNAFQKKIIYGVKLSYSIHLQIKKKEF